MTLSDEQARQEKLEKSAFRLARKLASVIEALGESKVAPLPRQLSADTQIALKTTQLKLNDYLGASEV